MPRQQAFNNRIGAWVIFDFKAGKGFMPINVKQKNPCVPFSGVKISPGSVKFIKKKSKKCQKR